MFTEVDQKRIDEWITKLKITRDSKHQTLMVTGFANGGWFCFNYSSRGELTTREISSQLRYTSTITGVEPPSWHEINAAWDKARSALRDPTLDEDMHIPLPTERINGKVAFYLATKSRVDEFGGFTGEKDRLPSLYNDLSKVDRSAVDDRLAGKIVI